MNADEIRRLLTNSGVHVRGVDSVSVFIEDPSCVLRGFETFLDYAWFVIVFITGLLLFGWAIALIRGSNNNIITNMRNLLIMFGVLGAVGPIVNLVWGDDLFARGCRTIAVPIDGVNKVLAARRNAMRPSDGVYEVLDIYDTGVVYDYSLDADDEPAPDVVVMPTEPVVAPVPEPVPDVVIVPTTPAPGERRAVSAAADGRDVIYTYSDSTRTRYTDGTPAWRNTNPGNIRYSEFTRSHGAIGRGAGGFAVFPDEETGFDAILALLQSGTYRNLTIGDAIGRYAPPGENDTNRYRQRIETLTGLNINRRISDLSADELRRVATAIRQLEGWRPGRKIEMGVH